MTDDSLAAAVDQNRNYWESLAPHRLGQPIEFFRTGGTALNGAELAAIGDVHGQRVLQLACSMGDEALSLAQLGADVVAVDLAHSHLATGRTKAQALGLPVRFVEADMMNLDPDLTDFDLVFISWGGICWAPDIKAWATTVSSLLRPHARLVISEHHPLWEVLTVKHPDGVTISGDYFTSGRTGYTDVTKAPQVTQTIPTETPPGRSYVWSLGAVVSALLAADLTITSLDEFAEPDMYAGLGDSASSIPATYLLTAAKTSSPLATR